MNKSEYYSFVALLQLCILASITIPAYVPLLVNQLTHQSYPYFSLQSITFLTGLATELAIALSSLYWRYKANIAEKKESNL